MVCKGISGKDMSSEIRILCPACNLYSLALPADVSSGRALKCTHCQAVFLDNADLSRLIVENLSLEST